MSLVDYQSSDESDTDDSKSSTYVKSSSNSSASFVIPGKPKESVKISVPSLKEFDDEDDSGLHPKKAKRSATSGLIGMLPPPKYARNSPGTFLPYALSKKTNAQPGSTKVSTPIKVHKVSNIDKLAPPLDCKDEILDSTKDDLEEEKESQSPIRNYFSLEEPTLPVQSLNVPQLLEDNTNNLFSELKNFDTSFDKKLEFSKDFYLPTIPDYNVCSELPEPSSSGDQYLTDEGFLRLQGKRRGQESISIIDVSADDQLTDNTRWLTKSLTEEKVQRPSMKKDQMPTQQQRRKHQITYLAFQAKEREQELRNQWSQNRLTKRETQAKYGF